MLRYVIVCVQSIIAAEIDIRYCNSKMLRDENNIIIFADLGRDHLLLVADELSRRLRRHGAPRPWKSVPARKEVEVSHDGLAHRVYVRYWMAELARLKRKADREVSC